MSVQGHCLCGRAGWEIKGEPGSSCYCHCDDCRRNCAAPVVAWLGVAIENFKWLGAAPKTFKSSKAVTRYFCGSCGTPLGLVAEHYPGAIHVYAASLDDPENFEPTFHLNYKSKLPWLELNDDLAKYEGTLQQTPDGLGDYQ